MRNKDEKLVNALKEEGKNEEYMSLNPNIVPKTYAPNSKFYGEVMEDGYVFNPFIHRRWLPAQFECLKYWCDSRDMSIQLGIRRKYSYGYEINFVVDEVNKLITLQRHDLAAYEERSKFFTLDIVKTLLVDYMDHIITCFDSHTNGSYNYQLKSIVKNDRELYDTSIKLHKFRSRDDYVYYKAEERDYSKGHDAAHTIIEKLQKANSFYEIRKAINIMPSLFELSNNANLIRNEVTDLFEETFWKSGVYYTIKHKIMFEHKAMLELRGVEACTKLRQLLDKGYSATQFQEIYDSME